MYYELLNLYLNGGDVAQCRFGAVWRFMGHNNAHGGGGWLSGGAMVGLVCSGGGVGWLPW